MCIDPLKGRPVGASGIPSSGIRDHSLKYHLRFASCSGSRLATQVLGLDLTHSSWVCRTFHEPLDYQTSMLVLMIYKLDLLMHILLHASTEGLRQPMIASCMMEDLHLNFEIISMELIRNCLLYQLGEDIF